MAFDSYAFSETLDEIEKLLGYLMGNERAFLYLRSARSELIQTTEELPSEVEGMGLYYLAIYEVDNDYRFPCPDGSYAVKPVWSDGEYSSPLRFPVFRPTDEDGAKAAQDAFFTTLKTNANLAYQQGVSWSAGIADYCRSVCAQFTEVSPETIADALVDLQRNALGKLHPQNNSDWATIEHVSNFWTGEGASAFASFYDNFNSMLGRCYTFTCDVVAAFGMLAMLTHGAQVGAQKFAESVRDNLKTQLAEWVRQESRPADPPTEPPWVADFTKIFGSAWAVVGDLPVVGVVKEQVDKFVGTVTDVSQLVTDIADVSGHKFGETRADVKLEGAEQIYTGLTDTLYSTYYEGYRSGLTQLLSGNPHADPPTDPNAALPFSIDQALRDLAQLKGAHQWSPGEVTHAGSMTEPGDDY